MAARECAAMIAALAAYDARPAGTSVRTIAINAGVSHTGLYYAIKRRTTTAKETSHVPA